MLCRHTAKGDRCPKHPSVGGDCPYNHRKGEFDEKGKYTGRKKKGKGKGRTGGQEGEDAGGWEEPLGYACRPCLLDDAFISSGGPSCIVYRADEIEADPEWRAEMRTRYLARPTETGYHGGPDIFPHQRAGGVVPTVASEIGRQLPTAKMLKALTDLPEKCFKTVARDSSGFQYHTKWRIGLSNHQIMLDGGSAVNSTTEELVLKLLNENEAAGIKLNDKRHPIKQLERWKHREGLRGVAGAVSVV